MSGLIIGGIAFLIICVVVCLSVYFTNSACSLGTWAGSDCPSTPATPASVSATTPPVTVTPVVSDVVPAAGAVQTAPVSAVVPAAGAVQTAAVSPVVPAAGAVQTAAVPPASALSGYTGPVTGFDYPYNDLGNWPTSDPNQCASYCASNPSCNLFVTATDSQNCWTKSAAQNKTASTTRNVYPKVGYTLP